MSVQDALNVQGFVLAVAAIVLVIAAAMISIENPRAARRLYIASGVVAVAGLGSFIAAAWSEAV
jgi:hypothetical protein